MGVKFGEIGKLFRVDKYFVSVSVDKRNDIIVGFELCYVEKGLEFGVVVVEEMENFFICLWFYGKEDSF